ITRSVFYAARRSDGPVTGFPATSVFSNSPLSTCYLSDTAYNWIQNQNGFYPVGDPYPAPAGVYLQCGESKPRDTHRNFSYPDGFYKLGCCLLGRLLSSDRKSTRLNSSHVAISYA